MDVTYGVKIEAKGGDAAAGEFKKVEAAARSSHGAIEQGSIRSAGAMERMAATLSRSSYGASSLLRLLGPIGGESTRVAEQFERVALRGERMAAQSVNNASAQKILNNAFLDGKIAAATLEAAQARVTQARQAAIAVEQAYARAVAATKIAQEESKLAQAGLTIAQGRTTTASNFMATGNTAAARAELATATRLETAASNEATRASAAYGAATAAETALTKQGAAAKKELAEATKLSNSASAAGATGFAMLGVVVGGLIAVFAALGAAIAVVKLAWDSMKEAGKHQADEFNLKFLIGDAEVARDRLKELNEFWQQSGIFAHADLTQAEKQLLLIGTGTEDLTSKLKVMSAVAAASGESVSGTVQAYQRLREAVIKGMDIPLRGGGSTGLLALLQAVEKETGLTESGVHRLFKTAKDSGVDVMAIVDRSLQHAQERGGIFFDAIIAKQKTWAGATETLGTKWEAIKDKIGAPLIDKFTPMLLAWADKLSGLEPQVEGVMAQITKAIEQGKFGELLASAFHAGVDEINRYFESKFNELMHNVFYDLPKAEWTAFVDWIKSVPAVVSRIWNDMSPGSPGVNAATAYGQRQGYNELGPYQPGASSPGSGASYDWGPGSEPFKNEQFVMPTGPGGGFAQRYQKIGTATVPGDFMGKTGKGSTKESDWAKYEDDLTKINQMWEEMSIIQSKVGNETEKNTRINELFAKTTKDLANPDQLNRYLDALKAEGVQYAKLLIQEETRLKREKEIDQQIRIGYASVSTSLVRGAQAAAEAWGNLDQQMAKAAGDITNALASDIAGGLGDILDGTKSVSDGFRDMARAIIKDIEQIILKMLVQLAIQKLLGAFSGGNSSVTGAVVAGNTYAVGGFTGNRPADVPAGIVHGGEYVFTKDQVDKLGLPFLTKLAGAVVGKGYQGGGHVTALSYGPVVGEFSHATNYGPFGNRLGPHDVAISQNMLGQYHYGQMVNAYDSHGNLLGTYTISDSSFAHGQPTTNTIEFRDANRSGMVTLGPAGGSSTSGFGGGPTFNSPGTPNWIYPPSSNNLSPTGTASGYPPGQGPKNIGGPTGTASGYPPGIGFSAPVAHGDFGRTPAMTAAFFDPHAANMSAFGLHDWNRGLWQTNPHAGEGGPRANAHHNIGALAAKFGMMGKSASGKWHGKQFFEGGFVDWPRWHGGGMARDEMPVIVQKGETILPRGAGNVNNTSVSLSVNFNGDGTRGRSQKGSGDQGEAAELERLVVPVIEKWAVKNKRQGGLLHSSTER